MSLLAIPDDTIFRAADLPCAENGGQTCLFEHPEFSVYSILIPQNTVIDERNDRGTLYQFLVGTVEIQADGKTEQVKAGEYFYIPAQTEYRISSCSEVKLLRYNIQVGEGTGQFLTDGKKPENAKKATETVPCLKPFHPQDLAKGVKDGVVITSLFVTTQVKFNIMTYDLNQKIGPHGRPFEGWITMLCGSIRFEIGDKSYFLKPGDCLKMPPDIVHCATALEENSKCQMVVIRKL